MITAAPSEFIYYIISYKQVFDVMLQEALTLMRLSVKHLYKANYNNNNNNSDK